MKISIVVPSFQQGQFIEESIRSIIEQRGVTSELIIIDGGSTDVTLDVIRRYESRIEWWISEPDGGQADAINKGLRRASGDVITWFGADDVYVDGSFAAVHAAWTKNPCAIYAAPVANFYARGREILLRPRDITLANVVQYWQRRSLWHDPGLFWSRQVIEAVGEVDASLRYAFDYDYLIRALQRFDVEYLDQVAAGFRLHHGSKSISQGEQMMAETAAVSERYWPLLEQVDRAGFQRAEHAARVRHGAAHLLRGRREGFALLRRALRERPVAALSLLARLGPTVAMERLRRLLPARHL